MTVEDKPIWVPSEKRKKESRLYQYIEWLAREKGLRFKDHIEMWKWSCDKLEDFWESIWQFFDMKSSTPYKQVLSTRKMPGPKWFEGANLNLAEHVFRNATSKRPALVFRSEIEPLTEISWADLERETARIAAGLRAMGVKRGDRVCAYVPNIPQAITVFLACASVGAIWSSCSPDMGSASILDRFRQIEPKVLFAVDGYRYGGKDFNRLDVVAELKSKLPTLQHVVLMPYLDKKAVFPGAIPFNDLPGKKGEKLTFEQLPFEEPLWVVYSSGTSGPPKPIVHGHGGMLIKTLKSLAFEMDIRPGDRFFWYTSTGWIMWNLMCTGFIVDCTIVIYDGNPGYPDAGTLWKFAAEAKATFVGTSPAFVGICMKSGIKPMEIADLSRVKTLGCSGAPLSNEAYHWIYQNVGNDILLGCGSGGTDIAGGFVGPNPLLPIYPGEMQCRQLGIAVHAFNDRGESVIDEVGEMIITEPIPSMPLYFWNDPGGKRYYESYYDMFPGLWRQGDWIRITARGGAIVYGRSDATINRHGLRMGTGELYRAIEDVPEVLDSLVVDCSQLNRRSWMPLFVTLRPGIKLDTALKEKINDRIKTRVSARFIPDEIYEVAEIPRTLTGKKMELPVKKLLLGERPEKVASRDAMANPKSLDYFVDLAAQLNKAA